MRSHVHSVPNTGPLKDNLGAMRPCKFCAGREGELQNLRENQRQPSGHRYACALEWWGRLCPDEGPPACTCDLAVERPPFQSVRKRLRVQMGREPTEAEVRRCTG